MPGLYDMFARLRPEWDDLVQRGPAPPAELLPLYDPTQSAQYQYAVEEKPISSLERALMSNPLKGPRTTPGKLPPNTGGGAAPPATSPPSLPPATRPRTVTPPPAPEDPLAKALREHGERKAREKQAEFEDQRRVANSAAPGETRSRYYAADEQYKYEHEMNHPDEKHKGWKNRLFHGLMGAGMGIMANAQPDQRGNYDLGRMLGGAAAAGAWSGVRPAAADTLYNKIFIDPEAQREREKQLVKEKVAYDKQIQGLTIDDIRTKLTGQQLRNQETQANIERGEITDIYQKEEAAYNRGQRGANEAHRDAQTQAIKAQTAENAAQTQQIQMHIDNTRKYGAPIAPGSPWWRDPDGSIRWMPEKDSQGNALTPQQVTASYNAYAITPDILAGEMTKRDMSDQGKVNQVMKQLAGEQNVTRWLSLIQAYEKEDNPKVEGMKTPEIGKQGQWFKAIDNTWHNAGEYQTAHDELEKLREKVEKELLKQNLLAAKRDAVFQRRAMGGVDPNQQGQPQQQGGSPQPGRPKRDLGSLPDFP